MFESLTVDLITLFKEKEAKFTISNKLKDCDIFTRKIFDKYEYKVTK